MRVLLVIHSLRRGGAERVLLELALGLCGKGHNVDIVGLVAIDEYSEERYLGIPRLFLIPRELYRWPMCIPELACRLARRIREFRPDVIQLHSPTVAWVAAFARPDIACIHLLQGYGSITRGCKFRDRVIRAIDRWSHRSVAMDLIVPAKAMISVGSAHFGIPQSRFACIPNGVDVHMFKPHKRFPNRGAPVIMMLGTLSAAKGQSWGLRALELLLISFPAARLVVVGEGSYRAELEHLVSTLNLGSNAFLLGRRPDAPDLMNAADVFWHLSESEGLPMVVLEAMATGLPVIGFDVRGTRDAVVNDVTGYLVPMGNIKQVAEKTRQLLENDAIYQRMATQSRRRVEQNFSVEHMVEEHESALRSAIAKRNRNRLSLL